MRIAKNVRQFCPGEVEIQNFYNLPKSFKWLRNKPRIFFQYTLMAKHKPNPTTTLLQVLFALNLLTALTKMAQKGPNNFILFLLLISFFIYLCLGLTYSFFVLFYLIQFWGWLLVIVVTSWIIGKPKVQTSGIQMGRSRAKLASICLVSKS